MPGTVSAISVAGGNWAIDYNADYKSCLRCYNQNVHVYQNHLWQSENMFLAVLTIVTTIRRPGFMALST